MAMSNHDGTDYQSPSSKSARICANIVASVLLTVLAMVRAVFKAVFGILSAMAG